MASPAAAHRRRRRPGLRRPARRSSATSTTSSAARPHAWTGCASSSTAPTAPPASSRRRSIAASARASTPSAPSPRAQHQRRHRLDPPRAAGEDGRRPECDLGIADDGDADRRLAVDADGLLVDGDQILAIRALALRDACERTDGTVASTVMATLGFKLAMAEQGIALVETAVGDRYVLEAMLRDGFALGGEQSGHALLTRHATTATACSPACSSWPARPRRACRWATPWRRRTRLLQLVDHRVRWPRQEQGRPLRRARRRLIADAEARRAERGSGAGAPERHSAHVLVMVEATRSGRRLVRSLMRSAAVAATALV